MLWLDAFGTPKNTGGVSELSGPRREFLCYEMRMINLYLCIVGPVGQFRRSICFG